jgi:hypothetical protein
MTKPEVEAMAYDYNRTAGAQSFFARKVQEIATSLEADLDKAVEKYTGSRSTAGSARVEVKQGNRLWVTLWLELGIEGNRAEAQELAEILIGEGVEVGPHSLKPTIWVCGKIIQL